MTRLALLLTFALATAGPAFAQRPTQDEVDTAVQAARSAQQAADDVPENDRSRDMLSRVAMRLSRQADSLRAAREQPETRSSTSAAGSDTLGRPARPGRGETVTGDRDSVETRRAEQGSPAVDAPETTDASFPIIPALGGIVALAAAGGAAWWFMQKRSPAPAMRTGYGPGPGFGAAIPGQTVPRAEFDRLSEQVRSLAAEHRTLSDWVRQDFERRQMPAAAPTPPAPTPAAPALAPSDAVAAAFADWCRQGTPMMSRVDFFSGALASSVPGASARAVYRDAYSQAEPVRFDDRGGTSPAEFWLVNVGGDMLLFPQPLNAGQFRDLARVFDGMAAPKTLGTVVPARVRDEGGAFALTAPGRVA